MTNLSPTASFSVMAASDPLLDVLLSLDAAKRRATYGAVATYLGGNARFLMNGRPRDPLHSWVVSKATGRPTGYIDDQVHEDLHRSPHVIQSVDELRALLGGGGAPPVQSGRRRGDGPEDA